MSGLFDKVLNFVGWEEVEEEEEDIVSEKNKTEEIEKPIQFSSSAKRHQNQNKVVNIHSAAQFKVVVFEPDTMDDAKDICDHLKGKKPIVVNLEKINKDDAQRILDFLSGSVYALDGNIQPVSKSIFLIAPNNVDIMGEFKDEARREGVFPWSK